MYEAHEPTPEVLSQIKRSFRYHPPKADQVPRYERLRFEAGNLAFTIVTLAPESRERSLAITKLEEAIMWANAAIARNEAPT
jgi:hypothetical protein